VGEDALSGMATVPGSLYIPEEELHLQEGFVAPEINGGHLLLR